MSGTLNWIDYLNIIVLVPFVILMCIITTLLTRKRKAYTIKSLKSKPSVCYLKTRIRAHRCFNESFPSIKECAQKLLSLDKFYSGTSINPKTKANGAEIMNHTPSQSALDGDQFFSVIEGILGMEFVLLEKLNWLYLTLVQSAGNKIEMQKAIRFEIKQRCMKHPHDIFGAQICKKINSLYQDVIDKQERGKTL